MIEKSKYRDRYHMLGWQPWKEVANYYRESDVGLNIDAMHYETIYGTRTRLVEMIAAGLPVITSLGCELSDLLRNQGAGLTFNTGDWRGLGEQILTLSIDRDLCHSMSGKALNYARTDLSFAITTTALRTWVQNPKLAPDKEVVTIKRRTQNLEFKIRSIMRMFIWQAIGLDRT
jgi:glycosyltransferase involved in cell wall biosynthesis